MNNNFEKNRREIINKTVGFIRPKVKESGTNGTIVGLSDGIDSTLTAYITTEAFGSNNVLVNNVLDWRYNDC